MSGYDGYTAYRDAESKWIDLLPDDWDRLPLKHAVEVRITDGPHETPDFVDSGIPFLSAEAVKNNKLDFTRRRGYITEYLHSEYSRKCLPKKGDVFMVKSGNTTGAIAMVETDTNFNIWSPLALIRADAKLMVARFIYFSMLSSFFRKSVELSWSQGTQPNIGMGVIENLHVCRPSLEEQQKIANFLDHETAKIDTLIEKQQQLIKLLKEKRQAVISHAVTKGLNPDAPMKDSGVEWLGEVPEHWEVMRAKQVVSFITSGPRGWSDFIVDNGSSVFLQSGDLNNSLGLELENAKRVMPPSGAEGVRTRLEAGDVVVCITGANTGRVAVVDKLYSTTYINQHLCLIRPIKHVIDSSYIGNTLSSEFGRSYFDVSQYGLKEGLSLTNIAEAPVIVPPISEQRSIVRYINEYMLKFGQLADLTQTQITTLKERRTALISAAVTGKIDVRNWQPPKSTATPSTDA